VSTNVNLMTVMEDKKIQFPCMYEDQTSRVRYRRSVDYWLFSNHELIVMKYLVVAALMATVSGKEKELAIFLYGFCWSVIWEPILLYVKIICSPSQAPPSRSGRWKDYRRRRRYSRTIPVHAFSRVARFPHLWSFTNRTETRNHCWCTPKRITHFCILFI